MESLFCNLILSVVSVDLIHGNRGQMNYFSSFLANLTNNNINNPNTNIPIPIHKFMLMPKDFLYISTLEFVKIPNKVIITPKIENIKPIGILISSPILISSYQKIILKLIIITPTIIARTTGRLYHSSTCTLTRGVSE